MAAAPAPAAAPEPAPEPAAEPEPEPEPAQAAAPAPEAAPGAPSVDVPLPAMEEPTAAPSETAGAEDAPTQVAAVDPSIVVEREEGLSVLFAESAQDLPAGAEPALDAIAERMQADPDLRLRLRGYAQAEGDTANQSRRVSLFRALAVRTYLMKRDVSSRRMDVQALGANLPGDGGSANRVDVLLQR
ncbi:MAG: OmpA family protein [Alphaproteobacteria bacterium]|nr:OmpA family protein [Alphaproteobacteria bacterium]